MLGGGGGGARVPGSLSLKPHRPLPLTSRGAGGGDGLALKREQTAMPEIEAAVTAGLKPVLLS